MAVKSISWHVRASGLFDAICQQSNAELVECWIGNMAIHGSQNQWNVSGQRCLCFTSKLPLLKQLYGNILVPGRLFDVTMSITQTLLKRTVHRINRMLFFAEYLQFDRLTKYLWY